MKIRKWKTKLSISASLVILLAGATVPSAFAFTETTAHTNKDGISVDVKQIKEVAKTTFIDGDGRDKPSQSLAQLVAMIVKLDTASRDKPEDYSGTDVLRYLYPKDSEAQLQSETINAQQALQWLSSVGYHADLINRPLKTDEIKKNLDKAQPIVTVLAGQNNEDWLYKNYCGILYAHDDVEAGKSKLHESFIKTLNSGEAILKDGDESQDFEFPNLQDNPDAVHRATKYKWTQTLTNFKRDPDWNKGKDIRADRAKGIFKTHLTTAGKNVIQADFLDKDVISLRGSVKNLPLNVSTTKLDAVALINLYFDAKHQKMVRDLEQFAKISDKQEVTTQQIEDWYKSLDFDFDVAKGKVTKALTKSVGTEGKLYLTVTNTVKKENPRKSEAIIGTGFADDTEGYTPNWVNVKADQIAAQYHVDPKQKNAMQILHDKLVKFDYDTISRDGFADKKFYSWDYNGEATIYNIHKREVKANEPTSFTTSQSNNLSQTSYTSNPNFFVRETQGAEPWCAEYTAAAAINTLDKVKDTAPAVTSAKQLMQTYYPGVPDEQLKKKGGPTIGESLKVFKDKYQVTADVEDKALNFDEVKKEIDQGQVIQLDAKNTSKVKEEKDTGHAMEIVGYVSSSDKSQAPYYEIWNPWWQRTFYLSVKSPTIRLAGSEYQWNRTWHHWRKASKGDLSSVGSDIAKEKVASTSNPESLTKIEKSVPQTLLEHPVITTLNLTPPNQLDQLFKPFDSAKSDLMNQAVYEMGNETSCHNYCQNETFGYSESLNGGYVVRARIDKNIKLVKACTLTRQFIDDIDGMKADFRHAFEGLSLAAGLAILGAVTGGAGIALLTIICNGFGISAASVVGIMHLASDYIGKGIDANLKWTDMPNDG